jgi:hypothetical protein
LVADVFLVAVLAEFWLQSRIDAFKIRLRDPAVCCPNFWLGSVWLEVIFGYFSPAIVFVGRILGNVCVIFILFRRIFCGFCFEKILKSIILQFFAVMASGSTSIWVCDKKIVIRGTLTWIFGKLCYLCWALTFKLICKYISTWFSSIFTWNLPGRWIFWPKWVVKLKTVLALPKIRILRKL